MVAHLQELVPAAFGFAPPWLRNNFGKPCCTILDAARSRNLQRIWQSIPYAHAMPQSGAQAAGRRSHGAHMPASAAATKKRTTNTATIGEASSSS